MKFEKELIINNSDFHYSCGYHDLTPFSPNERFLVFAQLIPRFQKGNNI